MEKLSKIQVSVLASYSMPFVLVFALIVNALLVSLQITEGPWRLIVLSASFPVGFSVGRFLYLRRAHVEILFDDTTFRVVKGSTKANTDLWKNYKLVSIALDQFGRPNLRLYKGMDAEYLELPISKTNANHQKFRDYVQSMISGQRKERVSLPSVGAA